MILAFVLGMVFGGTLGFLVIAILVAHSEGN